MNSNTVITIFGNMQTTFQALALVVIPTVLAVSAALWGLVWALRKAGRYVKKI